MSLAWDDEPEDVEVPEATAPRKRRKPNRFAQARRREPAAPLAPFLLDPSLLPKRPPGAR